MNARLADQTVAVLGFGHQGEAQAHNLRAAGVRVTVGARAGGGGAARARDQGFTVRSIEEATRAARVAAVLLPDEAVPALWPAILGALADDAGLVFAHGFNLLYGALGLPARGDVVLVSPTGPGHVLKGLPERGERMPGYLAVHQERSGAAWELAEAYARAIGCDPLWRTTVREETEVDLFGEQVVLCGGMNALVRSAFEALVERGYTPEIAYLECVHQLKYLADLLHDRGPDGFRRAISGTALYGDLTRGPRVIGEESRRQMRAILDEIRSGAFAREWQEEARRGAPRLARELEHEGGDRMVEARRRALGGPEDPGRQG